MAVSRCELFSSRANCLKNYWKAMTTVNVYFHSNKRASVKQTLKFRAYIHPTSLNWDKREDTLQGFILSPKADLRMRGRGVKCSFKACFLFSNLSVVSTHTDTLLIWLQSVGDCEWYGWNSAWNQFFYDYLSKTHWQHCSYMHYFVLWC